MRLIVKTIASLTLVYCISSCKYDKEVLEPEIIINAEVCDSVTTSFSADILPLLQQNCTPCHVDASSAGISVNSHSEIESNKDIILSSIKHEDGTQNMPRSADKLSDENIEKLECWILNGALDN